MVALWYINKRVQLKTKQCLSHLEYTATASGQERERNQGNRIMSHTINKDRDAMAIGYYNSLDKEKKVSPRCGDCW